MRQSTINFIFLGAVLAQQGRFTEAKQYHRRAAKLGGEDWDEPYFNLGLILRAEGKYRSALACFDKAIDICPGYEVAKQEREDVIEAMKIRKDG